MVDGFSLKRALKDTMFDRSDGSQFIFGQTRTIPELDPDTAHFYNKAREQGIFLKPIMPTIQYPSEPVFEEMPREASDLKSRLKTALMSMIPGYAQGRREAQEVQREDIGGRNKRAIELFKEKMDQAIAQSRQAEVQTYHEQMGRSRADMQTERERAAREGERLKRARLDLDISNVESLKDARLDQAELGLARIAREYERDPFEDAQEDRRIRTRLQIASDNLAQRKAEEAGRGARETQRQAAIQARMEMRMRQNYAPDVVARIYNESLSAAERIAKHKPLTQEQHADLVNEIADSFFEGKIPKVSMIPKEGVLQGLLPEWARGKVPSVKPGANIPPRYAAAAGTEQGVAPRPGANYRRPGKGRSAPDWLIDQYIAQAGDARIATAWLLEDGWK